MKMMNRIKVVVALLGLIWIGTGCGKPSEEELTKLFQQGQELQQQGKYNEAIQAFEQIIHKSEKGKFTAQAQFMIAFIYAENLKDLEVARKEFESFIRDYPDDPLIESAKWELENMGKKLEDLPFFKDSTAAGSDSGSVSKP